MARREFARGPSAPAQQLVVEQGWERAVETVLGSYLEAVSVDTIDAIASRLELAAASPSSLPVVPARRRSMAAGCWRAQGPAAISALLTGIIAVDTLSEALEKRARC